MIKKAFNQLMVTRNNIRFWLKRKRLKKLIPSASEISKIQILVKDYRNLWRSLGNPSSDYLKIYININGILDFRYVPENFYYSFIEPHLNNLAFTMAYADKNFYDKTFTDCVKILPETILRKINGVLYDSNYNYLTDGAALLIMEDTKFTDLIIKPASGSSGGRNIMVLKKKGKSWFNQDNPTNLDNINNMYPDNFIMQEKIFQSKYFSKLNESSVNTLRIFTYRSVKNNEIHILHSVLRIGRYGQIVDNQASGGISVGIKENGKLNEFAINKFGTRFNTVNQLNISDIGKVPQIETIKDYAKKLALLFPYHRLLAFDFCVNQDSGIRLLEVNLKNIEINFLQMSLGPLFGEFTEEIIEDSKNSQKSINFDFYV